MNTTELDYPKIRIVDTFPIETKHGQMIGLRDPNGIASQVLVLSPDIFYLLQFFDGNHSNLDLRYKYLQTFGNFLYEEQLAQVLHNLDAHLFLDNQNYVNKLESIEAEFRALPFRSAFHAGQSYEAEPRKLRTQIECYFKKPHNAGLPNLKTKKSDIKGLIAPHIDMRAGGACYTHAYKELAESSGADCFVILGTGHSGLYNLYSVLDKDFETPFGLAKCDREFYNLLDANYDGDATSEILSHKTEHSIEFQLILLQYLYQNKLEFKFVPILCSFSHYMLNKEQFPRERTIIDNFIQALKKTIAEIDKRVCLIASVDLSHVGLRYGDKHAPDTIFLNQVKESDQKILQHIENLNGEGFVQSIENCRDRYRVCGFSSIYTLLNVIEAKKGKLLNYSNTKVDSHNSTVTFASMVIK